LSTPWNRHTFSSEIYPGWHVATDPSCIGVSDESVGLIRGRETSRTQIFGYLSGPTLTPLAIELSTSNGRLLYLKRTMPAFPHRSLCNKFKPLGKHFHLFYSSVIGALCKLQSFSWTIGLPGWIASSRDVHVGPDTTRRGDSNVPQQMRAPK
jgi:hypothetical protein